MRAIVFDAPGSMRFEDRPVPTPGEREVLIKTAAVGICGTDIHLFDGEFEGAGFPMVPGHEASGWVEAVGDGVTSLAPGDPVTVNPNTMCGFCEFCQDGRSNLCRAWDGRGVMQTDGCCQEYFTAPIENVYKLQPTTDVYAASLVEPLACAVRAFDALPRRMGSHYLIYGAGTMGLMMAELAPRAGAASVTIVARSPRRQAVAEEMNLGTVISDTADGRDGGYDVVVDATGNPDAIQDGIEQVKPGGTFQMFGVAPAESLNTFSPFKLFRDEITIAGSKIVLNSFGRAVEMFEAGAINHKALVSHSFTLDEYEKAFDLFRSGGGRKIQIRPNDTTSRVFIDAE